MTITPMPTGTARLSADIEQMGPELRALAEDVDRGVRPPAAPYALIRGSELPRALVPIEDGGHGLGFDAYTTMLSLLARQNGAAAIGYNMHNVAIGSLFESNPDDLGRAGVDFREWVIHEVVTESRLFASAASELGNGARLRGITTTFRREGEHYVLNGRKAYVSLAGVADYYVVSARPEDDSTDYEISHFVVAGDDPGVSFAAEWQGGALRGTATAEMVLTETRIPAPRLYLGVEGMSLFKAVREPHWMTAGYLGAYLGLTGAIVDFTGAVIAGNDRHRRDPAITHQFAAMAVQYEAARALVDRAAAAVTTARAEPETNTLIYAAKHHLGETAQALAAAAVRLTGSVSMSLEAPMQRLLREVQFCSIMPAKPRDCLDYVARYRLGDNMFDVRNQNW